jgi:putative sigma-54 modulation protein
MLEEMRMKMDIKARSFTLTEGLRQAVVAEAMQYEEDFNATLHSLSVRLFDVNGIRGGIDKGCLVFARVGQRQATVVATGIDSDLYRAISAAFARLTRSTRHSMSRTRRLRRSRVTPTESLSPSIGM